MCAMATSTDEAKTPPTFRRVDDMPAADVRAWLASVDTFLVDCDGVMWRGTHKISGSADTIEALRAAGKRVVFVVRHCLALIGTPC